MKFASIDPIFRTNLKSCSSYVKQLPQEIFFYLLNASYLLALDIMALEIASIRKFSSFLEEAREGSKVKGIVAKRRVHQIVSSLLSAFREKLNRFLSQLNFYLILNGQRES